MSTVKAIAANQNSVRRETCGRTDAGESGG
jgi:hypothetical protein